MINTGWTKGPYGEGHRFPIKVTRQIIRAIQSDSLNNVDTIKDPIFGLNVPVEVPGVSSEYLFSEKTWKNKDNYKKTAQKLFNDFQNNLPS